MTDAPDVDHRRGGNVHSQKAEHRVSALAARQHGVVSRSQLLQLGFSGRQIDRRVETGRLHLLHRGVYAVGHRLIATEGRWLAAVHAVGPGVVLSHRSAAALHGFGRAERQTEVTAATQRRARKGIRIHLAELGSDEVTTVGAIPTTTTARTLLDLAAILDPHRLERAMAEAERLRLADHTSLAELVERRAGRPGTPALRAILADASLGLHVTRSELEDRFLALVDAAGLPRPLTNTLIEGFEVDCVWRQHRLIVELDGHASHSTRAHYERDRARDRTLHARGWRPVRVTWRQLHRMPTAVVRDLRTMLV